MSFTTALSGLSAAANNLSTTGNNIANANTTGFKKSRSEFVDVYASSIGGVSKTQPGAGVRVSEVAQQFNQGNLDFTDNSLDLAVSGEGFFTMAANPTDLKSLIYTRNGAFRVNKDGLVTNTQGQALLAYAPNGKSVTDGFSQGVLKTVSINVGAGLPTATSNVDIKVNLDSNSALPQTALFDPTIPGSYTKQTSATVFDSLGVAHTLTSYFVAGAVSGNSRSWTVHHAITDDPTNPVSVDTSAAGTTLTFDSTGKLTSPADGLVPLNSYSPPGSSAAPIVMKNNYFGSTQLSAAFSVDALKQDGLPAGRLTGIAIDKEGVIFARFSNGGSTPLGKVAMTRFSNPQGLSKLGDTNWAQSADSGEPIPGEAGSGNFGLINAGALEQSNVDLSAQLVNLIVAQQAYQANAQTITTENSIVQTILNIR